MSEKLTKARYPLTTVTPAAISALALDNVSARDFRPPAWWGRPDEIFMQEFENDTAYIAYLQSARVKQFDLTQPIISWRTGRPADLYTTNDIAIAVADMPLSGSVGYIGLTDSVSVGAGTIIHFIDYGVQLRVLDTDDDESEGWVNDNSDTCNVKVERLSGPAVVIPINTEARVGSVIMGEEGTPGPGVTTTPGDPVWNTMQLVGIYGSITRLQMESEMIGGWGTYGKMRDEVWFQHMLRKQNDLLFGHRYYGTDSEGAQGQLWLADGVVPQIQTYVMNAGALGVNATGQNLNDFAEPMFDNENSSVEKDWFCGSAQFRDIRKAALQGDVITLETMPGLQSGVENAGTLGANSMVIRLQSGKKITVHELRKAFDGSLSDWGVILDADNVGYGKYKGISEMWFEDIETPAQRITRTTDALIDTWSTALKDESTCGVWRGGTRGLMQR